MRVAISLSSVAKSVKVVELPGLPEHADVSDWFDGGGTVDDLKALVASAEDWVTTGSVSEPVGEPDEASDQSMTTPIRVDRALRPIPNSGPPSKMEAAPPSYDSLIELNVRRARPGGSILDVPEIVESVWGSGHQCIWARGEPFILCGPDGVGKTTLAQQLSLALGGIVAPELLGFRVVPSERRVLYLACDRPAEARRSFRRMVTEDHRTALDERLVVWCGPLPFDLGGEPYALLALARRFGCDAVVLDAVKDVAADLSRGDGPRSQPRLPALRLRWCRHRCAAPSAQGSSGPRQAASPGRRVRLEMADRRSRVCRDAVGRAR